MSHPIWSQHEATREKQFNRDGFAWILQKPNWNCHWAQLENSKNTKKSQGSLDHGQIFSSVSNWYHCESSTQLQYYTVGAKSLFLLTCKTFLISSTVFTAAALSWDNQLSLSSAERVLLLSICCGNKHNEKKTWAVMVFLAVFKVSESSSPSSCYLTFPHNSFQLRQLFIFPPVPGLVLTQRKQNYVWSPVSLMHTSYLNQSLCLTLSSAKLKASLFLLFSC